jgi:uncharacterized protein
MDAFGRQNYHLAWELIGGEMADRFRDRIFGVLKAHPEQRYKASEIAQLIFKQYPQECAEKRAKSKQKFETDTDFIWQLAAEVSINREDLQKEHPEFQTTEGRPRKYYYTETPETPTTVEEGASKTSPLSGEKEPKKSESDLYQILHLYMKSEDPAVYTRRIDEKRSSNKQGRSGNHWLHPDLVGLEVLDNSWKSEVRECAKALNGQRAKLWSFEVKLRVERWNVREIFFQAVSNSSWAHYGYLAAGEFEDKTFKELRMLSAAHGIGIIQLDSDVPSESQILIPAHERAEVDWDSANRLATENPDFHHFLKLVKQFHQIGEVKLADWPEPQSDFKK